MQQLGRILVLSMITCVLVSPVFADSIPIPNQIYPHIPNKSIQYANSTVTGFDSDTSFIYDNISKTLYVKNIASNFSYVIPSVFKNITVNNITSNYSFSHKYTNSTISMKALWINGTYFRPTNITSITLYSTYINGSKIKGLWINGTYFRPTNITAITLYSTYINGSKIKGLWINGTYFRPTNITGTTLSFQFVNATQSMKTKWINSTYSRPVNLSATTLYSKWLNSSALRCKWLNVTKRITATYSVNTTDATISHSIVTVNANVSNRLIVSSSTNSTTLNVTKRSAFTGGITSVWINSSKPNSFTSTLNVSGSTRLLNTLFVTLASTLTGGVKWLNVTKPASFTTSINGTKLNLTSNISKYTGQNTYGLGIPYMIYNNSFLSISANQSITVAGSNKAQLYIMTVYGCCVSYPTFTGGYYVNVTYYDQSSSNAIMIPHVSSGIYYWVYFTQVIHSSITGSVSFTIKKTGKWNINEKISVWVNILRLQ